MFIFENFYYRVMQVSFEGEFLQNLNILFQLLNIRKSIFQLIFRIIWFRSNISINSLILILNYILIPFFYLLFLFRIISYISDNFIKRCKYLLLYLIPLFTLIHKICLSYDVKNFRLKLKSNIFNNIFCKRTESILYYE